MSSDSRKGFVDAGLSLRARDAHAAPQRLWRIRDEEDEYDEVFELDRENEDDE